jgi:hypothetical protein
MQWNFFFFNLTVDKDFKEMVKINLILMKQYFAKHFFLYMNTSSLSCSSVLPTQATSGCVYITDGTQL